jgi:spermidine/putrescine transport system substrate-binding protein
MKNIIIATLLLAVIACSNKKDAAPQAASALQTAPAKTLNVYTWTNYFHTKAIEKFESENNVKISFSYFSSNEELLAKLQAGAKGYDVIVPSGYVVQAMKSLELLESLNGKSLSEHKNLQKIFQSPPYDPELEFVMPFAWGTTGLAVNTKRVKTKVDSWKSMYDDPSLAGQITMLDDPPEVLGSALKYLGYSLNERKPEALARAKALLKKQKPALKAYNSETIPLLESGDVAIAQSYSSDVAQVQDKHPHIQYVIPKEGTSIWADNLAIPRGAPSVDLARRFIAYMTTPEVAALQVEHLFINPVVDMKNHPQAIARLKKAGLIPTDEQMKTLEYNSDDPEQHEVISRVWTELKAE